MAVERRTVATNDIRAGPITPSMTKTGTGGEGGTQTAMTTMRSETRAHMTAMVIGTIEAGIEIQPEKKKMSGRRTEETAVEKIAIVTMTASERMMRTLSKKSAKKMAIHQRASTDNEVPARVGGTANGGQPLQDRLCITTSTSIATPRASAKASNFVPWTTVSGKDAHLTAHPLQAQILWTTLLALG